MTEKNYTAAFSVNQSPEVVFAAMCNPRAWWSEAIVGETDRANAAFYYHYKDSHRCTFLVTELVPSRKLVWHVLHNDFTFIRDKREWNDTDVVFEITEKHDETELRFTHVGLVPEDECFNACSDAWDIFIKTSLRNLITTGKGTPLSTDHEFQQS